MTAATRTQFLQGFSARLSAKLQSWRLRSVPIADASNWSNSQPKVWTDYDRSLVWMVVCLLCFGLVMVYSSTIGLPDDLARVGGRLRSGDHLMRQAMAIGIGMILGAAALQVPMKFWEDAAPWLFVAGLLLLALVLIDFGNVSSKVNNSRRWLNVPWLHFTFQPSEWAKLCTALYAANYMVRKMDVKENFNRAVLPMTISVAVLGLLMLAEPDMGGFLVIATIAMGILFLGGVNGRMMFLIAFVLTLAFILVITFSDYRRERIFAYLDPWNPKYKDKAYQLTSALIAIGRGEWFGQGLGNSVQKLQHLPEAHTDFVLAVIGEELGLIGVVCVTLAYWWLTLRIFRIGQQAIALDRVFSGLFAQGIGIWLGVQAIISIGVNLGALPTKGLTLPLVSFGGSAMMMNLLALALVLRVDRENRALMRGGRA